jgi:hypothetical protein
MATTTTNFGWDIPQSTDLVKDGATAIAALGQDIDTALVDLKGGTTGQVLAKASATDLDYSWTTPEIGDITAVTAGTGISGGGTTGAVTITNSMATAIDAKGDLIVGTGADTFSRLAVAADFAFVKADSTAATGLAWDISGFTSYTPTVTASSGSFTTVSVSGKYKRVGKLCFVQQQIDITTNGTAASAVVTTLPFTGATGVNYQGVYRENAATGFGGQIQINGSSAVYRKNDNTYPGGTGYSMTGSFFYEVA